MTKNDFMDKLREYLSYELPERLVVPHIKFYNDYFKEQVSEGKKLQDVVDELGDPQLIARTIIDSEKAGADGIPNSDDDPDFSEEMYGQEEVNESVDETGTRSTNFGTERKGGSLNLFGNTFGCLPILLVLVVLGLILSLVLDIIGGIFRSAAGGNPVVSVILFALLGWLIFKNYRGRR